MDRPLGVDPIAAVELGRSGVRVTRLGHGTGATDRFPPPTSEKVAVDAIKVAYVNGVRYLDTAPHYGAGWSERNLGCALRDVPRDSFVLSTKVGRLIRDVDDPTAPGGHRPGSVFDFSRAGIRRSLEESLGRTGLERFEIVFIHDPDDYPRRAFEEAYPALVDIRSSGLVRAIGVGMNQCEMLGRFVRETEIDCVLVAGRYTLLDQSALDGLLPDCLARGVGVVIAGVFNSGVLADPMARPTFDYESASPRVIQRALTIAAACERHGVPIRAAAMQFPFGHPAVTCVLTGARTAAKVKDSLDLLRMPIPPELWEELRERGLLAPHVPVPESTPILVAASDGSAT